MAHQLSQTVVRNATGRRRRRLCVPVMRHAKNNCWINSRIRRRAISAQIFLLLSPKCTILDLHSQLHFFTLKEQRKLVCMSYDSELQVCTHTHTHTQPYKINHIRSLLRTASKKCNNKIYVLLVTFIIRLRRTV